MGLGEKGIAVIGAESPQNTSYTKDILPIGGGETGEFSFR